MNKVWFSGHHLMITKPNRLKLYCIVINNKNDKAPCTIRQKNKLWNFPMVHLNKQTCQIRIKIDLVLSWISHFQPTDVLKWRQRLTNKAGKLAVKSSKQLVKSSDVCTYKVFRFSELILLFFYFSHFLKIIWFEQIS